MENNMNSLNIKAITDSNKQELEQLAGILIENSEGYELESYLFAKKLEYLSKILTESMHDRAFDEAERNKGNIVANSLIEIREVGARYDYSNTGYYPYLEKLAEKKQIEMTIKEHEAFLKAIKKPETVINQETGEFMDIVPPVKTSKTSIVIQIK